MFELCAVLGAGSERLRRYGHLLGVLYHGCDDVGDLRGLEALGGGGDEDVRDGILTLPAALAIRDPEIRELFVRDDADERRLAQLAAAYRAQLDEAEAVLDRIADSAREEAAQFAVDPQPLLALVEQVRQLSRQLNSVSAAPPADGRRRSPARRCRSTTSSRQAAVRRPRHA